MSAPAVASKKRVGMDLTQGSILRALLIFAAPMILTNIIQQLYSIVDLIIIGQFVGPEGTVAVATGGELIDFMTPLANAFAMGGQVYIAQLAGAKDQDRIRDTMGTLLTMMFGISLICMAVAIPFHRQLLNLLNCPEEAFSQAAAYMIITTIGMPLVFGYNGVCAVLRGMGESRRPLLFVSVAATVNIFLNLLLVIVIPLAAVGVAIATVASQLGAFLASFYFLYRSREQFGIQFNRSFFKIRWQPLRIILRMGIPQLIRSVSVHGSMFWVKANINAYGLVASATYSVGNKIEKLMNVFIQGVEGAAGAMIGQNIGARKLERVRRTLLITLGCTMILGVLSAGLFLAVPEFLFSLFTQDLDVIEYGVVFLRIMAIGCIVVAFSGPFKSIATGAGAAGLCFVIGVLDGVMRVLICLVFFYVLNQGAQSFFWGAAFCQLIPGVVCLVYFISGKWKTKKLLAES